jgi:hypothetical protein
MVLHNDLFNLFATGDHIFKTYTLKHVLLLRRLLQIEFEQNKIKFLSSTDKEKFK